MRHHSSRVQDIICKAQGVLALLAPSRRVVWSIEETQYECKITCILPSHTYEVFTFTTVLSWSALQLASDAAWEPYKREVVMSMLQWLCDHASAAEDKDVEIWTGPTQLDGKGVQ